jgi:ABC-type transport system involved in multi-copper enzyme maturation permease subunit
MMPQSMPILSPSRAAPRRRPLDAVVFLPIVARELRVASRRKGVYRLRLAAGLLTLVLGAYFLLLGDNIATTIPSGRILFLILSVLLALGAVAAAHETYDSISAEKREGTIGFLFLTELFPHDIVLGKLFAGALPSFYAMLATFPLLAAAALMGGVTGAEIWRMCLALLNLFFFAQSVALLASALFRARASVGLAAFLLLAFFTAGLPAWALPPSSVS